MVFPMDEADRVLWRIERLQAAVDKLDDGNRNAFGRRLGWSDGAFVRQMLGGKRAISDKLIRQIQELPGMSDWFDEQDADVGDGGLTRQVRYELLNRDVPEHVLQTFLAVLKTLPWRKRAA